MFQIHRRISHQKLNYIPPNSHFFQPLSRTITSQSLPLKDSSRPGTLLRLPSPWLALRGAPSSRLPRTSAGLFAGARGLLNILCRTRPEPGRGHPHAACPPPSPRPVLASPPGPRSPYPPAAGCVALPADMAAGSSQPPANYPPPPSRHFRPAR